MVKKLMKEIYNLPNRHGKAIEVITNRVPSPKGTVFIHHGYPGAAHSPTIQLMRKTFNALGLNTITPNTTNNYNNAAGELEDMTLAGHCDDLEDVIRHAIAQDSFTGPYVVSGHSAGGHSALVVSSRLTDIERPLLTIASAPVISGQSFIDAWGELIGEERMSAWKTEGFQYGYSDAGSDRLKMHWPVMKEWAEHDLTRDKVRPDNYTAVIHPNDDPFIPESNVMPYVMGNDIEAFHSIRRADHCYTGREEAFAAKLTLVTQRRLGL